MYIADQGNHRVRKVTVSTGIITSIAGTGSGSYSGDNGQATSAALYYPASVAVDSAGKSFIEYCRYFYPDSFIFSCYFQVTCTLLILSTTVSAR